MKKYRFSGGLFVTPLLITTSCAYLINNVTNTNDYSPPLEQAKHAQAQLLALHTTHNKKYKINIAALLGLFWLWTLARFYAIEKMRRILRRQMEDLSLLKIIKTNALRLWNNHRTDRKIIRLEDWRS